MSSAVERKLSCRVVLGCVAGIAGVLLIVGVQTLAWALLVTGGLMACAVLAVGISAWYADVPPCVAVSPDEADGK